MASITAKARAHKKALLIGLIIAVVILGVVAFIYSRHRIVTFSGTVTDINNGCFVDGVCSVTIDDRLIETGKGMRAVGHGSVYGRADIGPAGLQVDQKVNVRAVLDGDRYTLEGCPDCYIK